MDPMTIEAAECLFVAVDGASRTLWIPQPPREVILPPLVQEVGPVPSSALQIGGRRYRIAEAKTVYIYREVVGR